MPLWLCEADVRAALALPELIGAMERALAAFSAQKVDQPVRTAIEVRDRTFFASMPAYDGAHGILGAKLVTVFPENAARGLHTHLAAISLFDAATGRETVVNKDGTIEIRHIGVTSATITAAIFWLKTRAHWKELMLHGGNGPEGAIPIVLYESDKQL